MEQQFFVNGTLYSFTSEEDVKISLVCEKEEDGVAFYRIGFAWDKAVCPKPIKLAYRFPCVDAYTLWDPITKARHLTPWWVTKQTTESRLAAGMPLKGLISKKGDNAYLLACSDVKSPLRIHLGACERSGNIRADIEFFNTVTGPFLRYEALLRVDRRSRPFDRALAAAREWFDALGYRAACPPDHATRPMYSTWYSLWQTVTAEEVLRECREAVKYGMKTVIIDDGWQTDKAGMMYSYCGDWQPCESKFPDMKGLVRELHAMGLKVMLWFSMPFVGCLAQRHGEFEGMYLRTSDHSNCSVLDPRYKRVREYLVSTYVQAVKDWELDGLKLDFIDQFKSNGEVREGMDFVSVEDATECLLRLISEALRAIDPDILIEFRQPYFGPVISTYGNMIRVWDCPLDGVTNKTQTLNLRLVCGNCAVHSDMIYWHRDDTPESVATQLLGTLFAVPQISVRHHELTDAQQEVLRHYLQFWNDHRDTLTKGKLTVHFTENGYGYAAADLDGERIALTSSHAVFHVEEGVRTGYLFNITDGESIILKHAGESPLSFEVFDCTGTSITVGTAASALTEILVPLGGMLKVTR